MPESPNTVRLPPGFELKLEITEQCQARCHFCHQDFGERHSLARMDTEAVLGWIERMQVGGVRTVRFTGGEPTLHPGLRQICQAAHDAGLEVIVNTNGLGRFAVLEKIAPFIGTLKLSIPSCDAALVASMTGVQDALPKKLETLRLAVQAGMKVDVLTVMLPENIGNVARFLDLIAPCPRTTWTPLRVEASAQCPRPISREQIGQLARELLWVNVAPQCPIVRLGLATPFCAVDSIELGAAVFAGRAEQCGPFHSLAVDVHSHVMQCYSRREPVSPSATLAGSYFERAREVATVEALLPCRCQRCSYLDRCRGGCRNPHTLENRHGEWCDYLMSENA